MKKLLSFLLGAPLLLIVGFVSYKFNENPTMTAPYPYTFSQGNYNDLEADAPVVIIGDRMGKRLASFTKLLSETISQDLSTPIKVISLAKDGEGIHRTLQKVKKLKKLPLFLIYLGGGQENYEKKFSTTDIPLILKNFSFYNNDLIQTLILLYPDLSRLIYKKVNRYKLTTNILKDTSVYNSIETLKRNEVEFSLYRYHLDELFGHAKEYNSVVMAIAHPINLDVAPKESCPGSIDESGSEKLKLVNDLIKEKDFKSSFIQISELTKLFPNNATVHYLNGMVAKKLGKTNEAIKSLTRASVFDCKSWRATPVHNAILKIVAKENEVFFYDFNRFLEDNWTKNITFEDEIYPQNYYTEKMVKTLGRRIRKMLKL